MIAEIPLPGHPSTLLLQLQERVVRRHPLQQQGRLDQIPSNQIAKTTWGTNLARPGIHTSRGFVAFSRNERLFAPKEQKAGCVRGALHATILGMIISFRHKGLELFFHTGSKKGIQAAHAKKLLTILAFLEAAKEPKEMAFSGSNLHELKNDLKGYWAVSVNGNWRVIFRFVGTDVELVDYLDYH